PEAGREPGGQVLCGLASNLADCEEIGILLPKKLLESSEDAISLGFVICLPLWPPRVADPGRVVVREVVKVPPRESQATRLPTHAQTSRIRIDWSAPRARSYPPRLDAVRPLYAPARARMPGRKRQAPSLLVARQLDVRDLAALRLELGR